MFHSHALNNQTYIQNSKQMCDVFEGSVGAMIIFGMTFIAFASYISVYVYRRYYSKIEKRPPIVFSMDMTKICIGQGFAWCVNLINTHRNAGTNFDPLSWYFPTFIGDEFISVPLGVLIGKLVTYSARQIGDSLKPIHKFGLYYPENTDDPRWSTLLSSHLEQPPPMCSWFLLQMFTWICCVILSRFLGGLFIPLCYKLFNTSSPFYLLAEWVYNLDMSCDAKQWLFAGILRLVIDFLQILFVDFCNKYTKKIKSHNTASMSIV